MSGCGQAGRGACLARWPGDCWLSLTLVLTNFRLVQTKRCFIYRFVSTGSIEEKVYQRQLSKEGLTEVIGGWTLGCIEH